MRSFYLPVFLFVFFSTSAGIAQQITYTPGSGLSIESLEDQWKIRLLGYVQSTFSYHSVQDENSVDNEFFVRRARLDFILDLREKYQWFIELDGRGNRTELVLAQFDIRYHPKHTLRVGKFITPFSPENTRSSRALTTIERYNALNSLFLLPALDTQYGVMLLGEVNRFRYYFSISNGNGKASANLRENNNAKDLQLRIAYRSGSSFSLGGSLNYSKELRQSLGLYDHLFRKLNQVDIAGKRFGYLLDGRYSYQNLLLRGEYFQYNFPDNKSGDLSPGGFNGGYAEVGYFLTGDIRDGFQVIGRFEHARYISGGTAIPGPRQLNSLIIGHNWYMDGLFRLQTNLVYELSDSKSIYADSRWDGKDRGVLFLIMAQMKL